MSTSRTAIVVVLAIVLTLVLFNVGVLDFLDFHVHTHWSTAPLAQAPLATAALAPGSVAPPNSAPGSVATPNSERREREGADHRNLQVMAYGSLRV